MLTVFLPLEIGLNKEFVQEIRFSRPVLSTDRHNAKFNISESFKEFFGFFIDLEFA